MNISTIITLRFVTFRKCEFMNNKEMCTDIEEMVNALQK